MAAEPFLSIRDIGKRFGGLTALDGVSLEVPRGVVYGLIGPNGSGKTTLFNVITGFARPDRGDVVFAGRSLKRLRPNQVAGRGLVRTFQSSLSPRRLTVMENMLLAPQNQTGDHIAELFLKPATVRAEERRNLEKARALLAAVNLDGKADDYAGSLSGGQKKLLSLAQALMAEPLLVLLDEPVAGVNPRLIEEIAEVILRLNRDGRNFLVVEHNMSFIRHICAEVSVLDNGRVIAAGKAADVLGRDEVLEAYLGRRRDRGRDGSAAT
jgi:ABC-type branched-subunit amino acid transport system ATPase component